jgi:acetyl-CoA carboxylase biotin carboxyl carrier protein
VADLSFAQVGEILQLLQRIDGVDVTLEWGELKLQVRRSGAVEAVPTTGREPIGSKAGSTRAEEAGPATPPATASHAEPSIAQAPQRDEAEVPEHWVAIRAPMVGTFYRAPKPGEPPFAEVGDVVAAGDKVGLVEVMKLFTELSTEVAGKVARVDAEDATLVEYGQPLIWIEPA